MPPELLPSEQDRRQALGLARKVAGARGEITPESDAVLARIEEILGVEAGAIAPTKQQAAPARRTGATAK